MKSKEIILNTNKNLAIIESYNLLQILIFIVIKSLRIDTIIINKVRLVISIYFFIIVLITIKYIDLLVDRDLIFKLD